MSAIGAASLWALAVASLVTGLVSAPSSGPNALDPPSALAFSLAVLSPVTVGAILVIRLPRNLIGWLLLVSGLSIGLNMTTGVGDRTGRS
jgi:hypothetical protein